MGNGVGPSWFHPLIRKVLTQFSLIFFDEASWDKHDEGYQLQIYPRHICDLKFLQAMKRDASMKTKIWRMIGCDLLSWTFWGYCRVFGWISWKKVQNDK